MNVDKDRLRSMLSRYIAAHRYLNKEESDDIAMNMMSEDKNLDRVLKILVKNIQYEEKSITIITKPIKHTVIVVSENDSQSYIRKYAGATLEEKVVNVGSGIIRVENSVNISLGFCNRSFIHGHINGQYGFSPCGRIRSPEYILADYGWSVLITEMFKFMSVSRYGSKFKGEYIGTVKENS